MHGARVSLFHLDSRTSPLKLWLARRRLKEQLRAKRPDVVHVYYGSVAALFTVLTSSVPVVVTFMGDDLDRSAVRGFVRRPLGGFFSQVAAFFAAGIICANEEVREHLWWRTSEAFVLQRAEGIAPAAEVLEHLRGIALHKNTTA